MMKTILASMAAGAALLGLGDAAFAQAAAAATTEAAAAAAPAATVHRGDVAWMMTATLLVIFMAVPGLALFYGGLVRSKNML